MKSIRFFFTTIFPPLIGVILIYFAYQQFTTEQINEIKSQFRSADYKFILISLLFALIGYFSRAYRWLLSLDQMGYKVKFIHSFLAVNMSYLVNLSIPRSGEVFRAGVLSKTDNIPFQKSFGSIIAERIVDFIILILITGIVILFKVDTILSLINFERFSLTTILSICSIGLLIIAAIYYLLKHSGFPFILKIKEKTLGFTAGIQSITKLPKKNTFIFHTLLIWGSYIVMFYVTIYSFPETSNLNFDEVLTGFVVGSFAIVFTNGGFGAYPLLLSKVFLLYSVPETVGTAFGWIVWSSQIFLILLLGSASFLYLPFLKSNPK